MNIHSPLLPDTDVTPKDFEYDVLLIFKNCERYNGPADIHMVTLGKYTAKLFRKLFAERLKVVRRRNVRPSNLG